eukprot:910520-Rhodomonas_salina.1
MQLFGKQNAAQVAQAILVQKKAQRNLKRGSQPEEKTDEYGRDRETSTSLAPRDDYGFKSTKKEAAKGGNRFASAAHFISRAGSADTGPKKNLDSHFLHSTHNQGGAGMAKTQNAYQLDRQVSYIKPTQHYGRESMGDAFESSLAGTGQGSAAAKPRRSMFGGKSSALPELAAAAAAPVTTQPSFSYLGKLPDDSGSQSALGRQDSMPSLARR